MKKFLVFFVPIVSTFVLSMIETALKTSKNQLGSATDSNNVRKKY